MSGVVLRFGHITDEKKKKKKPRRLVLIRAARK